jgi:hypothetical protein
MSSPHVSNDQLVAGKVILEVVAASFHVLSVPVTPVISEALYTPAP